MPSEFIQRQIDRLLNEAEAALGRLDWDGVRAQADAILALDPENGDARALLDAAARTGGTQLQAAIPEAPSLPPLPTSFAGGRYHVRAFLGEGAKKRVYLANDTKLDRDVAFALIKTDGLDADGIVRVRREAQAMGRLGDNAHIVTARNFNPAAIMAGKISVVEVEEIVETGSFDPDSVHLPGIYVSRLVLNATPEKRIEKRTVTANATEKKGA